MKPLVSIVVPTRNRKEIALKCLESIRKDPYSPKEVFLVDDASTDDTAVAIRNSCPDVKVVVNEKRVFAIQSRNVGMKLASGKYLLMIDDDNVIEPDMIERLVEFCEANPNAGVVGPKMYIYGTDRILLWTGQTVHPITSLTRYRGAEEPDRGQYEEPAETRHIPNVLIIRRDVYDKIGGFDSTYRMAYADADLAERARLAGYRVMYCPKAVTWHGMKVERKTATSRSPMRAYYFARNRAVFMKRYSKAWQFAIFLPVFLPIFTFYYVFKQLIDRDPETIKLHMLGTWHGLVFVFTGKLRDFFENSDFAGQ